jgi:hypothetical protein
MGGMSLMTAGISVSNMSQRKRKEIETAQQADDYKVYLINEVSRLGTTYEEKERFTLPTAYATELSELGGAL